MEDSEKKASTLIEWSRLSLPSVGIIDCDFCAPVLRCFREPVRGFSLALVRKIGRWKRQNNIPSTLPEPRFSTRSLQVKHRMYPGVRIEAHKLLVPLHSVCMESFIERCTFHRVPMSHFISQQSSQFCCRFEEEKKKSGRKVGNQQTIRKYD